MSNRLTKIETLRRALEPFAKAADGHEDRRSQLNYAHDSWIIDESEKLTVGDLRRAREALAAAGQGGAPTEKE